MYQEEYKRWLAADLQDADLNPELSKIEGNDEEIKDRFAVALKFGTAGLRGVLGAGTNRMNIYVVRQATQGLANWVKTQGGNQTVAISYDSRLKSDVFAKTAAGVLAANDINVRIYDALMPVPALSFATRYYECNAGIMVTASHNPAKYNGYKAYWNDGAQMISPHDKNTIAEVNRIRSIADIKFKGNPALIEMIGEEVDKLFLDKIKTLSLSPDAIERHKDMKIVYTPIHGTGVKLVPASLKNFGFTNIIHVPEQDVVSGDFPTVVSPNPEEPAALDMAIRKGIEVDADIVMASDPDADRIGIAVKNDKGEFVLVNGNQIVMILLNYLMTKYKELGRLTGNEYIVKTIVTTELIKTIADRKIHPVEKSYTNYLLNEGVDKICKKVGEEASETIIAAKNDNKEELVGEISDLLFHTFVLMNDRGVSLEDIQNKLKERHQVTGNKKEFHTRGDY